MNKSILILVLFAFSCKTETDKNSIDQILDVIIETKDNQRVEFPRLYDSLFHAIPADSSEKLILVEKLKARGFENTDWGRGNYPPLGPRIVIVTLQKDNCKCEVSKIYYATISDTVYHATEAINCHGTDK